MATYNSGKFIRQQIDSVLNQTYQDFELLICDDCSNDDTREILNEYASKDSRIKLHLNTDNLGFMKNFENGISHCSGEYVAFCDHDDVWYNNKLELSINGIKDAFVLCTDSNVVDGDLKPLGYTLNDFKNVPSFIDNHTELLKHLVHHNFVQGTTCLCRKDFLMQILPIPQECLYHDYYIAVCAAIANKLVYLNTPTLDYRQHGTNITSNVRGPAINKYIPGDYNFEKISRECRQQLFFINKIKEAHIEDLNKYLGDAEKYYTLLPYKKISTVHLFSKMSHYIDWNHSKKHVALITLKKFFGVLRYNLIIKNKK